MLDELRRVALFTSGVAELTRHQAEQIVRDLVRKGDIRTKQASDAVKELVSTSKQSREMLTSFVRNELRSQIDALGLASKRDLERLERRIARLEQGRKKTAAGSKTSGRKKTAARRTTTDPGPGTTSSG